MTMQVLMDEFERFEKFLKDNRISHLPLERNEERYMDSVTNTAFRMWKEMYNK